MGWKDAPVVEEEQPAWATAPVVEAPATGAPAAYKPFATVRQDIDPATLSTDADWLRSSRMMYEMWERKPFEGSDEQLAEWGKDSMGYFNYNLVSMAMIAKAVTDSTQENKEAFLWMMDTYDNTNMSWEGAGRAVKGIATDPTTYVGIGTLGAGFAARQGAGQVTKLGIRQTLLQSLGRTGITAGVEGGVYAGTQSTIEQGIEVSAGRRDSISLGKTAMDAAIGVGAGVLLGTAADAAVTKIVSAVRGARTPTTPEAPPPEVPSTFTQDPDGSFTYIIKDKDAPRFTTDQIDTLTQDNEVGRIIGNIRGDDLAIHIANVSDEFQGKGFGTKAYIELANIAEGMGKRLASDPDVSQAANRVWQSLERRGFVLEKNPTAKWDEVDGRLVLRSEDGKPVYRVSEVPATGSKADAGGQPLGSTLTPTQTAGATASNITERQQAGRLRADEVVPDTSGTVRAIDVPEFNTGLRTTRLTDEPTAKVGNTQLNDMAEPVVQQLRETPTAELSARLEMARNQRYTPEQFRVLARAFENFSFELKRELVTLKAEQNVLAKKTTLTPEQAGRYQELTDSIADLEARAAAPALTDDAVGSFAGSLLQDRQGPIARFSKVTPESIAEEQGVTKEVAEEIFAAMVNRVGKDAQVENVKAEYEPKIQQALDAGNFGEAVKLAQEKSRKVDAIIGELLPESAPLWRKATEWAISNVFTIKTLFVNMIPSGVKTVMIPAIKAVVNNPLEKATRAEFAASYSAMRATFKSALRASAEAYKYESALLTRDSNRLLETGLAIKGRFGGAVRLFPRLLNSSDEFLSQINYAAYVAGRAAGDAVAEGTEQGLKGKALDAYIEKAVEKARKASFEGNTGDDLINPIIAKGLSLGYSGDDLFRYVEKELSSNGAILSALGYKNKDLSLLQRGTDEEALNFVRDVLYKKDFSGKGIPSKVVSQLDAAFRDYPGLKLITGQLFFRTPVRVFEEGVRLTPGLQILAPNFLTDLTGGNGVLRQVRAQGEALASLGMTGMILSLYSQGRITGDGAYENYHQQKLRGDGPLTEPYTIKMADGSTWSYRNFDPIATPVKIIVNALERYDKLRIREAQGEFIDATEFKKPIALISMATGAISRAFIDAGLTEGINQLGKIYEMAADPEAEESTTLRFIGDKLNLIVPNSLKKVARDNDPTIKDPATFWQMVEQKVLGPIPGAAGADQKLSTSYSYDALGNVRRAADTAYALDFFLTNSVEERGRGMSQEAQFVLQELDRLARVTGATFKSPIKHRDLGSTDLRTIMAADGERTLYDVWQQNYRSLQPEQTLYPILAAPLPDGTFKHKGLRVEAVRDTINQLQEAAFQMTMGQEQQVIDRYVDEIIKKTKSQAGFFDTPRAY